MENITCTKKTVKKDSRKMGWALLLYQGIGLVISLIAMVAAFFITGDFSAFDNFAQFAASILGLGFMFLFYSRQKVVPQLFKKEKPMTFPAFLLLLCVFLGLSGLGDVIYQLLSKGLGLLGLTDRSTEIVTALNDKNIFMRLSVWVLAPIGEELIFRGFFMRKLEKQGKLLAITVPAILFGVMHGNFMQMIPATIVGLALGYVAIEYNILWSILIHAINNILLATVIPNALENASQFWQVAYNHVLPMLCLLASAVLLIVRRKEFFGWIRANKWEKPTMRWTLLSVSVILFTVFMCLTAVLLIGPK